MRQKVKVYTDQEYNAQLLLGVYDVALAHLAQAMKQLPPYAPQELFLLQGQLLVQTAPQELPLARGQLVVPPVPQELSLGKRRLVVLTAPQGPTVPRKGLLHPQNVVREHFLPLHVLHRSIHVRFVRRGKCPEMMRMVIRLVVQLVQRATFRRLVVLAVQPAHRVHIRKILLAQTSEYVSHAPLVQSSLVLPALVFPYVQRLAQGFMPQPLLRLHNVPRDLVVAVTALQHPVRQEHGLL